MAFVPLIDGPKPMDARIFDVEPMQLRRRLLELPFAARFTYDDAKNVLYLNFEQLEVKSIETIEAIRERVGAICEPLGKRVHAVVNYEGFVVERDLEDAYAEMVADVVARWYLSVTRFATSAFMRAKLGESIADRGVSSYIAETTGEATGRLQRRGG